MSLFAISYTIILHFSYYRTVPPFPEVSSRGLQPRLQILPHPKSLPREGLTAASGRRAGIFGTEIHPYFLGAAGTACADDSHHGLLSETNPVQQRQVRGARGLQHPHSIHEVIICPSSTSQPFFCVIFER